MKKTKTQLENALESAAWRLALAAIFLRDRDAVIWAKFALYVREAVTMLPQTPFDKQAFFFNDLNFFPRTDRAG